MIGETSKHFYNVQDLKTKMISLTNIYSLVGSEIGGTGTGNDFIKAYIVYT